MPIPDILQNNSDPAAVGIPQGSKFNYLAEAQPLRSMLHSKKVPVEASISNSYSIPP